MTDTVECGAIKNAIKHDPSYQDWCRRNIDTVEELIRNGRLEEIDPWAAEEFAHDGFCLKACADGEQTLSDIVPHLKEWMLTDRIHILSSHGGMHMLDPTFPYNRNVRDVSGYWLDEVKAAWGLGYSRFFGIEHVNCKWCWLHGRLGALEQIRTAIRVKQEILRPALPQLKVGMLLQLDRGPDCQGRKRQVTRLFRTRNFLDLGWRGSGRNSMAIA